MWPASYNCRLERETRRRDAALRRVGTEFTTTTHALTEDASARASSFVREVDPRKFIGAHPWSAVLAAAAAGLGAALVARTLAARNAGLASSSQALNATAPNKLVIEVVGAGRLAGEPRAEEFPWKALAGLLTPWLAQLFGAPENVVVAVPTRRNGGSPAEAEPVHGGDGAWSV